MEAASAGVSACPSPTPALPDSSTPTHLSWPHLTVTVRVKWENTQVLRGDMLLSLVGLLGASPARHQPVLISAETAWPWPCPCPGCSPPPLLWCTRVAHHTPLCTLAHARAGRT